MEFVVAILVIALIAAIAYIAMQRRPGGAPGFGRPRGGPVIRRPRGAARHDPMANAVAEHAAATDPHDAVVAEQRLRAQAQQVAAPMQAQDNRREHQRVADQVGEPEPYAEPPPHADPNPYGDEPRR